MTKKRLSGLTAKFLAKLSVTSAGSSGSAKKINAIYFVLLSTFRNFGNKKENAMPYCVYMVDSEYMKMDEASPELTDIDEVYILCKAKNSERLSRSQQGLPPLEIDSSLIYDLFQRVRKHLNSIWWSPEDAVSNGKVICRP